jgi:predicted hydrocarbon binding protein
MKRNEFMKTCAGACGCGMLGLLAPLPASTENAGWQKAAAPDENGELKRRLDGAQERFAKLLSVMKDDLDPSVRLKVLRSLGRVCAQDYSAFFQKYRGDLKGYLAKVQTAWVERAEGDEQAGLVRVIGKPSPCACPLVKTGRTPGEFCDCSLGWTEAAFSTVLGKPVSVEIEESVLRGGTRCSFRIVFKA